MTEPRTSLIPGSLQALHDLFGGRWKRVPHVLTLCPALEELAVTLEEVAAGRKAPLSGDRGSLAGDVCNALTRAGDHLGALTKPTLKQLRRGEVTKLAATLEDASECDRVATVVRSVLKQLDTAAGAQAAWDDVIATLTDASSSVAECVLAHDQLTELLTRRGHEMWVMRTHVGEALREGGLQDAREVIGGPPPSDVTVAWVAFTQASLEQTVVRLGQVRFFDGRPGLKVLRDQCTQPGHPRFAPIDELTDHHIEMYLEADEHEHMVYARVEFTGEHARQSAGGRTAPPVTWAARLASDLVEAAGFRHGGTEWVLLDGGYYFTPDDSGGGSAGFDDPRRQRASWTHPPNEPTGEWLQELPASFAAAVAEGAGEARGAMDAVRWHREVAAIENADMRVALHVRRFEVQWSTGDPSRWQTWQEPLRHLLRDHWCRHEQNNILYWAGLRLHRTAHLADPRSGAAAAAAEVYENTAGASFIIHLPPVIRLAADAANGFAGGTLQRRELKEVTRRTRNGETARDWWLQLREAFDSLLNRAVRQRNRVIHGREPVPGVIATVDMFIAGLSATLAARAVISAGDGRAVDDVLEDERATLVQRFDTLHEEASALSLFK